MRKFWLGIGFLSFAAFLYVLLFPVMGGRFGENGLQAVYFGPCERDRFGYCGSYWGSDVFHENLLALIVLGGITVVGFLMAKKSSE